jgi:lauroyl/myristoyl acyltransferase
MNRLLFLPVAAAMALLQSLPLRVVAWLGRRLGDLAWCLDWHHRRQALVNLDIALGTELPRRPRERIARHSFRLRGEALLCAIKTSAMEPGEAAGCLQVVGLGKIKPWIERTDVPGVLISLGHFGNPKAYEFAGRELPWMQVATLYRRNPHPLLRRLLQRIQRNCRCRFFDEDRETKILRRFLREGNVVLGLMCDLNPGPEGLSIPFFGHPAATSAAPAVLALRHHMPLHAAVCFRTAPGRWRVEIGDEIPTRTGGRARAVEDILGDLNAHFENSIRRDPANWHWTHARWEHRGRSRRSKRLSGR